MSSNRLSWGVVALVVIVVAFLVVRTLRHDAATRTEPAASNSSAAPSPPGVAAGGSPIVAVRPDSSSVRLAPNQVSSVQRAKAVLKARGYYHGAVDDNFTPTVVAALKAFQKDAGMKPTGYLDRKTYAALGIEFGKRRPAAPAQPPAAGQQGNAQH